MGELTGTADARSTWREIDDNDHAEERNHAGQHVPTGETEFRIFGHDRHGPALFVKVVRRFEMRTGLGLIFAANGEDVE